MKRYYRKNRPSVALFLVSNLLAAGSSVFMSFLLGTFADSAMEGNLSRVWKIALVTLFYLCIETFFAFLLDYSRDIVVQRVGRGSSRFVLPSEISVRMNATSASPQSRWSGQVHIRPSRKTAISSCPPMSITTCVSEPVGSTTTTRAGIPPARSL